MDTTSSMYRSVKWYTVSSLLDIALLLTPDIFWGANISAGAVFRLAVAAHLLLIVEAVVSPHVVEDPKSSRKRHMAKICVGAVAVFTALVVFKAPGLLFFPLLLHRVYFEMNTWVRSNSLKVVNDVFLFLCIVAAASMPLAGVPGWDISMSYAVLVTSLLSWLSASMSEREHRIQEATVCSKDRMLAVHRMMLTSLKRDIRAELGKVSEVCFDPEVVLPASLRYSLDSKWAAIGESLDGTDANGPSSIDVRLVLKQLKKHVGDSCTLVANSWGSCRAYVNRGLLTALLRGLIDDAVERSKGKPLTVWITTLSGRVYVSDNAGDGAYKQALVDTVSSKEFREVSGLRVFFESQDRSVIGGKVAIRLS